MTRTFLYKFVEVHKSANAYGIAVRNSVLEIVVYYYVVSIKFVHETEKIKKHLRRNFHLCTKKNPGFFSINI